MKDTTFGNEYWNELHGEGTATRKCLERISAELFGWKPHETSMTVGSLALLIAEIPRWIYYVIEKGEIDFATFGHSQAKTSQELVKLFDGNMSEAKKVMQTVSDKELEGIFSIRNRDQILFSSTKKESVMQSVNHLVHHRGQLTLCMRMNNIPVPSIYGPSGDEPTF